MMHHHFGYVPMSPLFLLVVVAVALLAFENDVRRTLAVLLLLVLIAFGMCGCADMPATGKAEIAWQTLNVVDAGQTVTIAREPSYFIESRAQFAIGAHPTERHVYEFMAGYAVLHYAVYRWLDHEDEVHPGAHWGQALAAWECVTLGEKVYNVGHNASLGIGLWGKSNDHVR